MSLSRKKKITKLVNFAQIETPPESPGTMNEPNSRPDLNFNTSSTLNFNGKEIVVSADDVEVLATLGRGQYGHVDKVRHRPTGLEFAVKRIRSTDNPEEQRSMLMDLKVNSEIGGKCPYIVNYFGALARDGDLWICMEVMDASLDVFYKKVYGRGQTIPESVLGHITFAIVSGLNFLKEELKIIHRDVKPSNILLSKNGEVKLCDFGVSGKLVNSMAKTNIGCQLYMAPERVDSTNQTEGYGVQSDVWSLGVTLVEVATGKYPYSEWKSYFQQMKQVVNGPEPRLPSTFSADFCDFVAKCCQKDSRLRPKYKDLLEHPFIKPFSSQPGDISAFVKLFLTE